MDERILQALRVRGRASGEALQATHGPEAAAVVAALVASGHVVETRLGYALTEAGRERATALFAGDVQRLGTEAGPRYDDFCAVNGDLKQVVTDWQLRTVDGVTTANDHDDPVYDGAVIARLAEVHDRVTPILEALAGRIDRFDGYLARLGAALAAVTSGDTSFVAAPLQDSYHTVWFELHEDLILVTGRTRAEEAVAGRG